MELFQTSKLMPKKVGKREIKKKQLEGKHQVCHQESSSLLEEPNTKIQGLKNQNHRAY